MGLELKTKQNNGMYTKLHDIYMHKKMLSDKQNEYSGLKIDVMDMKFFLYSCRSKVYMVHYVRFIIDLRKDDTLPRAGSGSSAATNSAIPIILWHLQ